MSYDAFISYSHSADDKLAPALQGALHKFAKPWWKMRAVNVFRDGTSLAAAHDLSEAITSALTASRFFAFLAAPRAAQSKWCQRELEYWVKERSSETLLIVLTDGAIQWDETAGDFDWSVTDALPRTLSGVFKAEPLWLDMSWARTGEQVSTQDPRFHQGVAMLAARLHGKSLDEIAGEDVRQHRRTRLVTRAAAAGLAALTLSSLAGAWFAVQGQRRAERNLEHALAATDTLVSEVAEGMRDFYGVPRERLAAILKRVEGIIDTVAAVESSEAIVGRRAAMMRTLARSTYDLGDSDRADVIARQAEAMIAPLAQRLGPTSTAFALMADLQADLFDIARRRSDYAEAQSRSGRYRELAAAMAEASKSAPAALRQAALDHRVEASRRHRIVALDYGRLDEALAAAREAVAAADDLLGAFPDGDRPRFLAASERAALAEILDEMGRPDEAMVDLNAAAKALDELGNIFYNRVDIFHARAKIEMARARVEQNRDDWLSAKGAYETAAEVLAKLAAGDPGNVALTADLAMARQELAEAAAHWGDVGQARKEFVLAGEHYEGALRISPNNGELVSAASRSLQREAAFLEDRAERPAALTKLDRAADLSEVLVRQRGVDDAGVLVGVSVRASRAGLYNREAKPKQAAADLERAEVLLDDLGRPAAPKDLVRAIELVVDMTVEWTLAGRSDRALRLADHALAVYRPTPGVSDAASVRYRTAVARLLMRKAAAHAQQGDGKTAGQFAQQALTLYEAEIVPHSRQDLVFDGFGQLLIEGGDITNLAGDTKGARAVFCSIAPKLRQLAPDIKNKPRLLLTALQGEFRCAEARLFGGEKAEATKLLFALGKPVDDAVPLDEGLQRVWRSLRVRIPALLAAAQSDVGDQETAAKLLRLTIRYGEDAVKMAEPAPRENDLLVLAYAQGQLSDALEQRSERKGAIEQATAAVKSWRRAVEQNRGNPQLEMSWAKARMSLAQLVQPDDPKAASGHYLGAMIALRGLPARVPESMRQHALALFGEALYRGADAEYELGDHKTAIGWHREALGVAERLVAMAPADAELKTDLARQHGRMARALHGAKLFSEARAELARGRDLLVRQRESGGPNLATIDQLIGRMDRFATEIASDDVAEQTKSTAPK